jgi:hypothetical protein
MAETRGSGAAGSVTDRAGVVQVDGYYLDRQLSLSESTRRFSDGGRETPEEGYYVVAIRKSERRGWVFRFSSHEQACLSIVATLNRPASDGRR